MRKSSRTDEARVNINEKTGLCLNFLGWENQGNDVATNTNEKIIRSWTTQYDFSAPRRPDSVSLSRQNWFQYWISQWQNLGTGRRLGPFRKRSCSLLITEIANATLLRVPSPLDGEAASNGSTFFSSAFIKDWSTALDQSLFQGCPGFFPRN